VSKDWLGEVAQSTNEARAVAITVRAASPQDAACVYNFLGIANQLLGEFGKAIDYHMQCLAIAKEMGDRAGEGRKHTHTNTVAAARAAGGRQHLSRIARNLLQ
jgi:hypothetical protein